MGMTEKGMLLDKARMVFPSLLHCEWWKSDPACSKAAPASSGSSTG